MQPFTRIMNARSDSAVVIINLSKKVTFANHVASEVFNWQPPKQNGKGHGTRSSLQWRLPNELIRVHDDLRARLKRNVWNSTHDAHHLKQIIEIRGNRFMVRAFTISIPQRPKSTHFLILLDKLLFRSCIDLGTARHYYRFSTKEFEVVQCLVGGRTNKEIATELNIAECTVKEYLRTVMDKVKASTRAGVVAQVLTLSGRDSGNGTLAEEAPRSILGSISLDGISA